MCLSASPELIVPTVTRCPHLQEGDVRTRRLFCGCCQHYMCTMCAVVHEQPLPEETARMRRYKCHFPNKNFILQKEQLYNLELQRRFNPPYSTTVDVIV